MTTTATETQPKNPAPPYMSYRGLTNLTQNWKVHLPMRIDRSVLGTYSGGAQSAIMSALRYLRLINAEGEPTDVLNQLVKSDGAERQRLIRLILKAAYPMMFESGFDITKATPAMINERFARTGATGDTLSKCLSFFAAMAKDAGIQLTPHLKTRQRRATNGKRTPKPGGPTPPSPKPDAEDFVALVGYERLPIPGVPNAYIQYPSNITDSICDLFEGMIGVLRTYAKSRSGKEKKA